MKILATIIPITILIILSTPALAQEPPDPIMMVKQEVDDLQHNQLTLAQELGQIQGAIPALATKADLESVRSELKNEINNMKTDLEKNINTSGYITWGVIIVLSVLGGKARQFLKLEP